MKFQASQAFYKSLFDNMVDGLAYCQIIFDKNDEPVDSIYIYVNDNFEKLTGLKRVVGKKAMELLPGIDKSNPELLEVCARVSLTGKPERFETHVEPLSRWFSISVYSPKKNFFVAVFQNITDQKHLEKNLENAKIAARNVLEDLRVEKSKVELARVKEEAILLSIGDGLIATDEKGNIILINKMAERLLGKKSEELIGKVFSESVLMVGEKGNDIPLDKHPTNMALATSMADSAGPTYYYYYYVRKDNTKFPAAIMVTPIILDGKVIGTVEVFRDVTREKEVDKAKSEFVSLASHQLRTPLTAISWYTEMILKGDVGKVIQEQKKYLEKIYDGNRRMVELVNTLLDVSRIELGTFVIEPKPTDVIALAQSVLDEQKPDIEKKKLAVSQKFGQDIAMFPADPKLLRMVFQNLLSNAVEYTPAGGRIEFSIHSDAGKDIAIKISDTGYGIPKSQQDQIFTKLFRADNVRDKDTSGTGLGLYIVKSIVLNSGGKIWFESEENKGTVFHVTLPFIMTA